VDKYDVGFVVSADTAEARREVGYLEADYKKLADFIAGLGRGPGGGGGGGGGVVNPPHPGDDGETFGKAAGKQIGKIVAGYMLHEATGLIFRAMQTPGRESPQLAMAQSITGKALQYGTMGTMAGMAFGPWGSVIGGGIGALAGGVAGYFGAEMDERDKAYVRSRQKLSLDMEDRGRERSLAAMKYMTAEGRLFDSAPGREARVEMIGKEADTLRKMLEDVTARLKSMIDERADQSGPAFLAAVQERGDLATRLQQLEAMKFKAGLTDPLGFAAASDFTDAFSKRGLYVGATVNPGDVNERIASVNEAQLEVLKQIADSMRNISMKGFSPQEYSRWMNNPATRDAAANGYPSWMLEEIAAAPDKPVTTIKGRRPNAIWTH